ncbi:MAG: hypothetical protein JJU28_18960 [Cyclobacteriaceae bacterium]|nr:hypothetical protein [Cyclobacteriaceae bacterium]
MHETDEKLLDCLNQIQGSGSFVTSHVSGFVFPNLEIEGFGELGFPITEYQAKGLIGLAKKAPFGKGQKTIVDEKVRRAWEIDAENIHFNGDSWDKFLSLAILNVKENLGLGNYQIEARLYKLIIYEKDNFFLSHKDTEKEKGMFGTLIIAMPSKHTGGELLVEFEGEKKSIQFDLPCSEGQIPYAAFYADCNHEVKPIESGYRMVLVYNLIQLKSGETISADSLNRHVSELKSILIAGKDQTIEIPKIILLGHQYTPANFSYEQLKLNDRAKATALLRAAKEAGFYSNLCLITSCMNGMPEDDGYYGEDYSEEMGEVFDSYVMIEKWVETSNPALSELTIQEEDLLAAFKLDEDEPLIKESEGYMGNYGPELTYWYHYGAVIIWSQKQHMSLLAGQNISTQLHWLDFYNRNRDSLSDFEQEICNDILQWLLSNNAIVTDGTANFIAEWFISENDKTTFESVGCILLDKYFSEIKEDYWAKLLDTYGFSSLEIFFKNLYKSIDSEKFSQLLRILLYQKNNPDFRAIIENSIEDLPVLLAASLSNEKNKKQNTTGSDIANVITLELSFPQNDGWVNRIADLLFSERNRKYVNEVLVKTLIELPAISPLTKRLLQMCKNDLQNRVDNKPQPFTDWAREMPKSVRYKDQWSLLKDFMKSPTISVFDYKKVQYERGLMEDAIRSVKVDLEMETLKSGSPHTLRITKNQKSYESKMRLWEEDKMLLERVLNLV